MSESDRMVLECPSENDDGIACAGMSTFGQGDESTASRLFEVSLEELGEDQVES